MVPLFLFNTKNRKCATISVATSFQLRSRSNSTTTKPTAAVSELNGMEHEKMPTLGSALFNPLLNPFSFHPIPQTAGAARFSSVFSVQFQLPVVQCARHGGDDAHNKPAPSAKVNQTRETGRDSRRLQKTAEEETLRVRGRSPRSCMLT